MAAPVSNDPRRWLRALCCAVSVAGGYAKHDEHVAFVVGQVKPYLQPGARVAAQFARE